MMKKSTKNKSLKNKLKLFAVTALAFAAISATTIGVAGIEKAYAEEWKGGEIKQNYVFGETLKVPEYVLSVNGKQLKATSVVEFPDGTNFGSDEVCLSQAGKYGVKYMAIDGGKIYVKTFDFNVGYTAYSMSGTESSAVYGKYTEFEANSEGLQVRLAKGDTLSFTKLIDVADLTSTNNIIEGFITPDKRGTADFDKLTLTLTDAIDSSIYVNIDIMRWTINNNALGQMCVAAAGQGQVMTGYEASSGLEVNNGKGTLILGSWVAQFNSDDGANLKWGGAATSIAPDKWLISTSFDAQTTKISAQGNLVSQLNSVDYYKDIWTGFKSDKVRLSLSASGYSSTTANFCLTKVLGADIAGNTFSDDDSPIITVNTHYEKMPEGVVGRAYALPTATAYDDYSGNLIPDVSVYYNYSSAYPVSVSVLNGAFVPEKAGYYALVYSVKDYSGNESEEVYVMHAGGDISPIRFVTLPDIGSQVKLGYPIDFGGAEVSGGSGDKNIKITAAYDGETFDVTDGFRFEKAGEWTVTYTATDYVGNTEKESVTVTAVASDEPFFNESVSLAPVFIEGSEYLLPELYCDDYSSGKQEKKLCSVKVEYKNGETATYKSGDTFIPVAKNSGDKVKITYYCGKEEYNNGTTEVAVLKIRDDQEINCSEYFYGNGFITSYVDDNGNEFEKGVLIAVERAAAEVRWTFANAQVADAFLVEFTTFAKLTKFSGIKVTLKDSMNPAISATLNITLTSTGTTIANGDFALDLKTVLTSGVEGVRVGYKNSKFSFNKTNVPISKYDNGETFNGFPSGKVYFDFAIENASRGAEYKIDAVSGNVLSSDTGDYAKPTIQINGDYGGNYNIGDEYILRSVTAGDTFSPNVSVKLSVYDGEGNIATDKNGIKLENVDASREYVIKLDKYGVWNARYTANKENWAVGSRKFTAYINVIDTEAPVIEITSGYTKTAKAGDTIILPNFTATDNLTASDKLIVTKYVINTEGKMTILDGSSNAFRTTKVGKYVMCISVSDEFGNTSTKSFIVTVE
mgnify:FL=1